MIVARDGNGAIAHPRRRLAAYWIDISLLYVVLLGMQATIATQTRATQWLAARHPLAIYGWIVLSISAPMWLYFTLAESSEHQATIGKRLLGLRVVERYDGRLSVAAAFKRTLIKLGFFELGHISFLFPSPIDLRTAVAPPWGVFPVVILMTIHVGVMWLTPCHQALHDRVCGTTVVMRQTRWPERLIE